LTFQIKTILGFVIIARKEEEESVHLYCARFVFSEKEKYAEVVRRAIQNSNVIQNSNPKRRTKGDKNENKTYRIIDVLVRVRRNFLHRWRLL